MMRRRYQTFVLFIFLFLFCSTTLPVWAQTPPTRASVSNDEFSAEKAYEHILHLSEKIGPRPAGSKNEHKAAEYLYYMLQQYGWKVREQPFSKIVVNPTLLQSSNRIQVINSQNIIAELPGKESASILIGAHYDTADISAPGAVDNASGVGVVLELARILGKTQHEETYQIVFFGAEEYGLVGSSYFVGQSDLSAVQWMLNLDMVGTPLEIDIAAKKSSPPELVHQIVQVVRNEGIPFHVSRDFMVMTRDGVQGGNSDFSSFLDEGIPAVGLGIAGRAGGYFHRPEDRIEKVDLQQIEKIGQLIPHLLSTVHTSGTGQRTWDAFYLPFQFGSYLLILPTVGLRIFFILTMFLTGFTILKAIRQRTKLKRETLKNYLSLAIAIPLAALFVSLFSGTGELFWQFLKGKEIVWNAYPEIFLIIRVFIACCAMVIICLALSKCPRPQTGNLYWLIGNGLLVLISTILALYRIDLAFPFLFWLLCFNLLFYFPSFILLVLAPYFIYKSHWELLNSEQWLSFYEIVHQYSLLFTILYALFLIPYILAGLFIVEKRRWPWKQMIQRMQIPALVGCVCALLGLGLIPSYTNDYPQPVSLRKEWSETQAAKMKITGKDTLPKSLLKELNFSSGKTIEIPVPAATPPMQLEAVITQTGERVMNLSMDMNYKREPYLVRIKMESSKPFYIVQMDEFLPISKLPRKIKLEGKEQNGVYSLMLERTPPHRSKVQWTITSNSTMSCSVETIFADEAPSMILQNPKLSPTYEEICKVKFDF
jgi:hypothetical protein